MTDKQSLTQLLKVIDERDKDAMQQAARTEMAGIEMYHEGRIRELHWFHNELTKMIRSG